MAPIGCSRYITRYYIIIIFPKLDYERKVNFPT